jgi:cell division protein FtsB
MSKCKYIKLWAYYSISLLSQNYLDPLANVLVMTVMSILQLHESSEENMALMERNQSLVQHVSKLEAHMQNLPSTAPGPTPEQLEEQEKLALQVKTLSEGKSVLEIKLSGEVSPTPSSVQK